MVKLSIAGVMGSGDEKSRAERDIDDVWGRDGGSREDGSGIYGEQEGPSDTKGNATPAPIDMAKSGSHDNAEHL